MSACPVTPEHAEACPATPERAKSSQLDSSSDDDNDRNSSQSPSGDVKCAICLSNRCKNKCFTDSCLHQFCFKCLSEWSKIKAECPLCKQTFKSIIHNVKSIEQYEEYLVQPNPPNPPPVQHQPYHNFPFLPNDSPSVYHRLDFLLSEPPRFTYSATLQVRPHQGDAIQQLFLHHSDLTERYSREYANDSIPFRQHAQEWRQYIYERELYALPLADITGRVRECSANFYRNNPAQIHRLMPWLNRELVALLRNNAYQVNSIMTDIQDVLMQHDITSEEFRQYCRRYCRNSTNHFIHEFLNYARSPYDMIGYDRNVRYTPYFNSEPQVISSSDDETTNETTTAPANNDDVIRVTNPRTNSAGGRTQFTIETRSAHSTVIVTGSFGGGASGATTSTTTNNNEVATTTTSTTSSTSTYTPQPISNRRLDVYDQDVEEIAVRSSSDSQPTIVEMVTQNISLSSDTDSDECRFVLERKPPHLRTPEMVSLGSESDSDVVYVDTGVDQTLAAASTALEAAVENGTMTRSRKRIFGNREDPPPGIFEPSTEEPALASSSTAESPTKQLKTENPHSTMVTRHSVKPELDVGASTSTGATSSIGSHPPIKMKFQKYYAKPRYLRSNIATRSILEASSSSDSETESSHEEFQLGGTNERGQRRKRKSSVPPSQKRKSDETERPGSRKRAKRSVSRRSRSARSVKKDNSTKAGSSKTKKMLALSSKNAAVALEKRLLSRLAATSSSSSTSSSSPTSSSLDQSTSSSSPSSRSSSVGSSKSSTPVGGDDNRRKLNSVVTVAKKLQTSASSSSPSSSEDEPVDGDSEDSLS